MTTLETINPAHLATAVGGVYTPAWLVSLRNAARYRELARIEQLARGAMFHEAR